MSRVADYADLSFLGDRPERYDTDLWFDRQALYNECWRQWSGEALKDEDLYAVGRTEDKPALYPLQLNLIQMACILHAGSLLGETDKREVPIDLEAKPREDRGGESVAEAATTIVGDVLEESGAMSFFDEVALSAMVFGGAFLRVAFEPSSQMGVRVMPVWTEWVRPVWTPDYRLAEIFVAHLSGQAQAEAAYNVDLSRGVRTVEGNRVLVVEHWTKKQYKVMVAGQKARYSDGASMSGSNPFGEVPFVYLPRYRMGSFYGESLVDGLVGLQEEINLRLADLGDALSSATHRNIWVKNRRRGSQGIDLSPHSIINLGTNPPQHPEPEMGVLTPPDVPAAAMELVAVLINQFRNLAHTPAVCYGEDEGSQRSALTLAFRMFPFVQMVTRYRRSWSHPLCELARLILKVMQIKGLNKVSEAMVRQLWRVGWAAMIPRDREQLINETILLVQTMLRSPETAMRLLGDVPQEQVDGELEAIKRFQEMKSAFMRPGQEGPITDTNPPVVTPVAE